MSVLILGAFIGLLNEVRPGEAAGPPMRAMNTSVTPSARAFHEMAYDAESNRIVLFGGYHFGCRADTWAYDVANNLWQNMNPPVAPPARCAFGMAYDEAADRVILFGGDTGQGSADNDTWAYDLNANAWANLAPAVSPPGRVGGRLAYDVRRDRVILFGGHTLGGAVVAFNDTWTYDLNSNTWTRITPATSPPPHAGHVMAYDEESDRVVLFGGQAGLYGVPASDTWAYDAANHTWQGVAPTASPSPRAWDACVYDSTADRILMFGGDDVGENETWAYDLNSNAWSEIPTALKPSDRVGHAMAYDSASDRTVLFGGMWPSGSVTNPYLLKNRETWVFDLTDNTWTMVLGPLPPVAAFTFSPSSPVAGDSLTLDGSGSSDPDGTVATFTWDFGGDSQAYGVNVTHTFPSAGTFMVRLVVADDDGLTNTTTRQIVVGPAPDTVNPTIAITSPADGVTLTSATVTITGNASDNVGIANVELSLDATTWTTASGTTSWSGTLNLAEGANTVYARATDTSGNTFTASIDVTVHVSVGPSTEGLPAWGWILMAVGIVAGAVAVFVLSRRRRKDVVKVAPPPPPR